MKSQALTLLAFLFFFQPVFAQFQRLDQVVPSLLKQAGIPGLSLAVIENGRVAYGNAFGVRSTDGNVSVDDRTVFAAASLSKPLFTFAVMQLVEEGKFDLDRPLADYLEYKDLEHDPRYRRITARMVLSHTSGLPNWRSGRLDLTSAPGESFQYSGEGFVYLQQVVERITGLSTEALMQQKVFKPLGMSRSSYIWQKEFENDFAIPHNEIGITANKYKPQESNVAYSLQTTAPDYARFVIALLNGIGMRKSAIDQMFAQQVKVPVKEGNAGSNVAWGLGWGLQGSPPDKTFWHWGDNGTFKCFVIAFPERKSGLVYFTNSTNGLSIVGDLVKEVFNLPCAACDWIAYPEHDEPAFGMLRSIMDKGFESAIAPYKDANGRHHNTAILSEQDMNSLGYQLMAFNRLEDAKKVLRMNTLAFPNSSNVYDSYGEALLRNGEFELARENYGKAHEMDKTNKVAESILQQLTGRNLGKTTFSLEGYSNARLITLAGDFNGWNDISLPCRRRDGVWTCSIDLTPGRHFYKFVVDGVWIPDPANPEISNDGRHNSVIEAKGITPRAGTVAVPVSPAKDFINQYAEAVGGREAWKELKSYIIKMRNAQSIGNSQLTAYMKKPGKYRIDLDNPPNKMIKSYNGFKGVVSINYRAQDMGIGEQKEMAEEADFFDELILADDKGYLTELQGTAELDGKKVYKIKLTKNKNDEQVYYLDANTYLPMMMEEYSQDENFKGVLFKTKFADYRVVDGLKFPYKITLLANDNILWDRVFEDVKVNPKVDDKIFEGK
jgi:CubicO group peptidase (beta-lactamase class C family)/tetratricopeptide (TPR) repeat protein